MKDDIRKKFEQVLETDEEKRIEAHKVAEAAAAAKRNREVQWSERIAGTLYPAIQAVSALLAEKGWQCRPLTDKNSLRIDVYRGDMRAAGGSGWPHISFDLENNGTIRGYQAGTSLAKSDDRTYRIEEITADYVQERILGLLEVLTRERPRTY